jgi:hypothetical protein
VKLRACSDAIQTIALRAEERIQRPKKGKVLGMRRNSGACPPQGPRIEPAEGRRGMGAWQGTSYPALAGLWKDPTSSVAWEERLVIVQFRTGGCSGQLG